MEQVNKGGRPPKYTSKEELQKKIDEYFESCYRPVTKYNNSKGVFETIMNEDGEVVKEQYRPFTMSGLAYALDIDRTTLINYSKQEEFFDTIMRAKRRCEVYTEERLFDREGNRGAIFSLSNNFKNWADKQTIETTKEPVININMVNNDNLQEEFFKKEEEDG